MADKTPFINLDFEINKQIVHFKIRNNAPLKMAFQALCARNVLNPLTVMFKYQNNILDHTLSPLDCGMKDYALIVVEF